MKLEIRCMVRDRLAYIEKFQGTALADLYAKQARILLQNHMESIGIFLEPDGEDGSEETPLEPARARRVLHRLLREVGVLEQAAVEAETEGRLEEANHWRREALDALRKTRVIERALRRS